MPPWLLRSRFLLRSVCVARRARAERHVSRSRPRRGGPGWATAWPAPAPDSGSARAGLRQLLDLLSVVLRDEAGAGVHRLAAAEDVAVDLVQVQQHDGQVALGVLL